MFACALVCWLLAASPPFPEIPATAVSPWWQLQGQPVLHVDIEAPTYEDRQKLEKLIDIHPGYFLSQSTVQAAVKRLYALNKFSQIEVYATPIQHAVSLRFVLTPIIRLGDLLIHNMSSTFNIDLQSHLSWRSGEEIDSHTVTHMQQKIKQFLARSGFVLSQIKIVQKPTDDIAIVDMQIYIEPGPARRVKAWHIQGTPRLPQAILHDMLPFAPNDILNLEELEKGLKSLRQVYIEHGFLRVDIGQPTFQETDTGTIITLKINAFERTAIDFVGNTVFHAETLRKLWPQADGSLSASTLQIFNQRLISYYQQYGYALVQIKQLPIRYDKHRIGHIIYKIDEGPLTRVRQINYTGAQAFADDLLNTRIHTILRQELEDTHIFVRLTKYDQALATADQHALRVPSEKTLDAAVRWVPSLYQQAAEQIIGMYRDMGYLQAKISMPKAMDITDPNEQTPLCQHARGHICDVDVQINIIEGPQTFVQSIGFMGQQAIHADILRELIAEQTANQELRVPIRPGAPFSASSMEDARIALIRHYRNQGYLYVRIFAEAQREKNSLWSNVTYTIEEGPQVHLQRILVRGNRYTREGVIRSRLSLSPGDIYRLDQALADQRSIASLGVFQQVRVKLLDEEHPHEAKDLIADVTERKRQSVEVSPGLSTAYGPRLRLVYSHNNMWGTASTLTASIRVNRQIFFNSYVYGDYAESLSQRFASFTGIKQLTKAVEREVRLGLRSPPLRMLPFDPTLHVDLVDLRVNAVRYSLDAETLILGADMIMPAGFRSSLDSQIGLTDLQCFLNAQCNDQPDVRHVQNSPIDVGQLWTFKNGPLLIFERRDNPASPTRGFFVSGRYNYAIGGARPDDNANFVPFAFSKYEGNITGYVPLWGTVLALGVRAGTIDVVKSRVPINERFFLGGRDTVRGFVENTMIPQDACVVANADQAVPTQCLETVQLTMLDNGSLGPPLSPGGNTFVVFKHELRLPLGQNLSFDLFLDLGNLWVDIYRAQSFTLRMGTGIGLRYNTPVGAIAIDYGINPYPRPANDESSGELHFSIGAF